MGSFAALETEARRQDADPHRRPRHVPVRERVRHDPAPEGAPAGPGRGRARTRCARSTGSTRRRCRTSSRCAATRRTACRARRASAPRPPADLLRRKGDLEHVILGAIREKPSVRKALIEQADELRMFKDIATLRDGRAGAPRGPPHGLRGRREGGRGARHGPARPAPRRSRRLEASLRASRRARAVGDPANADRRPARPGRSVIARTVRRSARFNVGKTARQRAPRRSSSAHLQPAGRAGPRPAPSPCARPWRSHECPVRAAQVATGEVARGAGKTGGASPPSDREGDGVSASASARRVGDCVGVGQWRRTSVTATGVGADSASASACGAGVAGSASA